jgi:CspA family cold shock protein
MSNIPNAYAQSSADSAQNIINEIPITHPHGQYIGNVKWFNKQIGFGFIKIVSPGDICGKDIFAHHSCIRPLNSNFRTLRKGEYVHLDVVDGEKGLQAGNITGILGGPLMCDSVIYTPMDGPIPM